MNEKMFNLINDPNIDFVLLPTPRLQQLITSGEHPRLQKLRKDAQTFLLEGKVIPLDKEDVIKYLNGTLDADATFLFATGEIRVIGEPSIMVPQAPQRS